MLLQADGAKASGDEGHSSVAPKLLHDMQSQSLTGMRLLQHLQVGCLMGCLTHLSLAGESPFETVWLIFRACMHPGKIDSLIAFSKLSGRVQGN